MSKSASPVSLSTTMNRSHDSLELLSSWRCRLVEDEATGVVARVQTVQEARVKVDVQIQAGAKALHEGDGTQPHAVDVCDPGPRRRRAIVSVDRGGEESRERAQHLRIERSESAQFEREREHPLAHRHSGENAVDQVRRRVGHAPARAARTGAAKLAREGGDEIVIARVASRAKEAVREDPAAQVFHRLDVRFGVFRQPSCHLTICERSKGSCSESLCARPEGQGRLANRAHSLSVPVLRIAVGALA